jgi:hypothetical protein
MKTTKKFIVFLIPIAILASCNNDETLKNKYTLTRTEDSLSFKIGSNSKNISNCIQYFKSDGVGFLALENKVDNSIIFYNIKTGILCKELRIPLEGSDGFGRIGSFLIRGFDSLMIFNQGMPKVGLIDSSGNLYKTISYERDINNNPTDPLTATGGNKPFGIGNDVYLAQAYRALESNGRLTAVGQKKSFIALSINLISGKTVSLPLTYPEDLIGKDVSAMGFQRVLGDANSFVYHFGSINKLFVTKDHIQFSQFPLKTIYDLKTLEDLNAFTDISKALRVMLGNDEIYNLYYDEFRKCYYVLIRKREDEYNSNSSFSSISNKFVYPNCFILILDKNLNHLGEVFFTENTYSFKMCFITEKGLYISEDHIDNPSFNDDYMRFRLFTLEKTKK